MKKITALIRSLLPNPYYLLRRPRNTTTTEMLLVLSRFCRLESSLMMMFGFGWCWCRRTCCEGIALGLLE
jgi:hypothetical protein